LYKLHHFSVVNRGFNVKKIYSGLVLIPILFLNACTAAPTPVPTETVAPSPLPSQTSIILPVTPVESAFAPGNPTAAPLDEIIASHEVTFETPDGATIKGELYGSGKTVVIFSVMGDCKPGWRELAQLTAAQGMVALTYPWRDCGPAGPISEDQLVRNFVNDARGAINFAREQGAEKVVLAGASLGGIASAKLAVESGANGLIIFASPPKIPNHDFVVEASDLDTNIPKLFVTAEKDSVVPADETRKMYEMAAEPKEWQTYPGTAHGTDLFKTDKGKEAQDRILAFILEISKAP
jgi:alpha-beta hydrolase superfamily lysophospholipase